MHWRKNTHLLDQFRNMISRLPQILPKQKNIIVCTFYYTNILNWPLNLASLHGQKKIIKNKPNLAKSPTEPIDLMVLLLAPNVNFACNNQAAIDTTLIQWHRHRQIDSILAQWCWGIQWGWQSYFRVTVPFFITTLLKYSSSMCAHWAPSCWWRPRPPPSLPMPRNGIACGDICM